MKKLINKGKLIVIDGADGSGKATQVKMLVERFLKEKKKVKSIDFPRYGSNHFGTLIGRGLAGELGDFVAHDPHIISTLYAADRFESSGEIKKWLEEGHIVVADRYVSANQIHQGGKIQDSRKRKKFLQWLDTMEFEVFKIPRPDIVLFLDVPLEVSFKLLKEKDQKSKKTYLKNKKDVVENSLTYMKNSRDNILRLIKDKNTFTKIDCTAKGEILPREHIHEKIYSAVIHLVK